MCVCVCVLHTSIISENIKLESLVRVTLFNILTKKKDNFFVMFHVHVYNSLQKIFKLLKKKKKKKKKKKNAYFHNQ